MQPHAWALTVDPAVVESVASGATISAGVATRQTTRQCAVNVSYGRAQIPGLQMASAS